MTETRRKHVDEKDVEPHAGPLINSVNTRFSIRSMSSIVNN